MKSTLAVVILASVIGAASLAQEEGTRVPSVTLAPVGRVALKPGGSTTVQLDFRVGSEFHINSNKPHSELLIPTVLKLGATTPVSVASLKYPAGQDLEFAFAPGEKLSVYSGDFSIYATVKVAPNAAGGQYPVEGELRFQACDRSACYPPRSIPVKFNVTVSGN